MLASMARCSARRLCLGRLRVRRYLLCARACCHGPCCPAGALLMWSTSMWRSSWPSMRVSYGQILRSCRKGVQQRPLSCKSSASNGRGAQRFMKHFATTQNKSSTCSTWVGDAEDRDNHAEACCDAASLRNVFFVILGTADGQSCRLMDCVLFLF